MQKCANLLDPKNSATRSVQCWFAKVGFDTAEKEPFKAFWITAYLLTLTSTAFRIAFLGAWVGARAFLLERRRFAEPSSKLTRKFHLLLQGATQPAPSES